MKHLCKTLIILLIATLTLTMLFGCDEQEGTITLAEFQSIKNGMSYQEVCEIIGSEGELTSSVDLDIGSEYATEIYTWEGEGSLGANAVITFQDGKVVSKAQAGLE